MSKWKLIYAVIVILLFSINGEAQIIRAHPFYVNRIQYLLDYYPGATVAYSLRKLTKNYNGSAINVRRSSDNVTQDIGFTSDGDLDTASIKTFVGVTSTDTGFIVTWYDQLSLKNVTQSTNINQPSIIISGKINRLNNLPSAFFDGVNDRLGATDTLLPTGTATYLGIHYSSNASLANGIYRSIFDYGKAASNQSVFYQYGTDANFGTNGFGLSQYGNAFGIASRLQKTNFTFGIKPSTTGTWNLWINNTLSASKSMTTTTTLSLAANSFTIGSTNSSLGIGSFLNGYISEIIIYPSSQSTNRTGLENNVNNYYKIW